MPHPIAGITKQPLYFRHEVTGTSVRYLDQAAATAVFAGLGGAVQVGTIEAAIATPFVQPSSASFPSSGGDLSIVGSGFGTDASDIRVYLMSPDGVGRYLST